MNLILFGIFFIDLQLLNNFKIRYEMNTILSFYLCTYSEINDLDCCTAVQQYRNDKLKVDALAKWNEEKDIVVKKYIDKLCEIFNKNDEFLLFNPPTDTKIFIDPLITAIKNYFPKVTDYTYGFIKKEPYKVGKKPWKSMSITELAKKVKKDKQIIKNINTKITKAFVIDDVYSSGKSLHLISHLIGKDFGKKIQIKSGIILKTDPIDKSAIKDLLNIDLKNSTIDQ